MKLEIVAEGIGFPEGPVICDDGSVIVCEMRTSNVIRIRKDGSRHVVAHVPGAPNGLAFGPDGALYCCNHGGCIWEWSDYFQADLPIGPTPDYAGGSIDRINISTGRVEKVYEACDGISLAGPNDLVFDRSGDIWFSDLGKNLHHHDLHGGLYRASPDGNSIARVAYGVGLNGVGLSPDGATVYGAASFHKNILAFQTATQAPQKVMGVSVEQGSGPFVGTVVAGFTGHRVLDSLAVEADGTIAVGVCVADTGTGIARINPNDGSIAMVEMPDRLPTNIAFGGADMTTAYVVLSATGRLARVDWPSPGLRLAFNG